MRLVNWKHLALRVMSWHAGVKRCAKEIRLTERLEFFEPDTATGVLLNQRHVAKISLLVKPINKGIEQLHLKRIVVLKKCSQQIGFIPRSPFIDPVKRVFERIENVMQVNIDTAFQAGKQFKKDEIHITVDF
jgi:hypothetical protein